MQRSLISASMFIAGVCLLASSAQAADWNNSGGNSGRNSLSTEVGPSAPTVLWSGSRPSINAFQAVAEGNRVFMVRQPGLFPVGEPMGSPVVCQDLLTGAELWHFDVPYNPTDGTTWIGGVSHGRVYASRAGYPYANPLPLYCLDAATGAQLWVSVDTITGGGDGLVFAPNGDPIVGSSTAVSRIDHVTGATVWNAPRHGFPGGGCGVVITSTAVYATDTMHGIGIKRFDLATGAPSYATRLLGQLTQTSPMVGPDGTIYQFTQESSTVCHYIALTDTGMGFVQKWSVSSGLTAMAGFGVGPDGSVYHLAPNNEIHRLDPATGATLNTTGPLPTDSGSPIFPHFAIDAQGKVFLTNGQFSSGILASYNADLSLRWSISIPGAYASGPVLGQNGALLIAGMGMDVIAFRDPGSSKSFCFGDGTATACPCGNSGASGHGCASSASASGAQLQASGNASVSNDTLILAGSGMPNSAVLYFQGTGQNASGLGTAFGDGLRCAGGTIVRLGVETNVAGASQYPSGNDMPISVRGQIPLAGGVRTYQGWYRNAAPYCTPSTFNLTNGIQITWQP
jgi:outer membrane protein assembly factor BamB